MTFKPKDDEVIEATRQWVSKVVIGLNLCPFAEQPFTRNQIRFVVSGAMSPSQLVLDLTQELQHLAATPRSQLETTVLIHPGALEAFAAYHDFLPLAEELVERLGLRGKIQIVGFHPLYQFAETKTDAVENYTNRSPFPMLHLLREDSISEVASNPETLAGIPKRNIETLRKLGFAGLNPLLKK